MEVLLEYGTSRRPLKPSGGIITRRVLEDEFQKAGWSGSLDVHDTMFTDDTDESESSTCKCNSKFILQRWEHKWNCFIDVSDIEEVKNGDRLTVVLMPGKEQTTHGSAEVKEEELTAQATSLLSKVKKATKLEANTLAKLFPSSSKRTVTQAFDPTAECMALPAQKKKKASRPKPVKIEVFLLPTLVKKIPRKSDRKALKEASRSKVISVTRHMSTNQVKNVILREYAEDFPSLNDFLVLECESNNFLKPSSCDLDGNAIANKRGILYICEKSSGQQKSEDEDTESDLPSYYRTSSAVPDTEIDPICISSDTDCEEMTGFAREISRNNEEMDSVEIATRDEEINNHEISARDRYILESRAIRLDQDQEHEESLRADEEKFVANQAEEHEKELQRQRKLEREERMKSLREALKEKFEQQPSNGIQLSFCLPDSSKLYAVLKPSNSCLELYELVFAKTQINSPYLLYTMSPRCLISPDCTTVVSQLDLNGSVLVIEENEDAPDPLMLFEEDVRGCFSTDLTTPIEIGRRIRESAERERLEYQNTIETCSGVIHTVRREYIFDDVMEMYQCNLEIVKEFPLRVKYSDERAIDTGGVARDMLSMFWESAYLKMFDGGTLLIPAVHHQVEMEKFPLLGMLISHGYIACGFLPGKIAFPILAAVLLGAATKVSDKLIVESFIDYLVTYDGEVLKEAFIACKAHPDNKQFNGELQGKLVNLMSHFGCREIPKPKNLRRLVTEIGRHEFTVKAVGAVYAMNLGLPHLHQKFWNEFSVEKLYSLYKSLIANHEEVLKMIREPDTMNGAEERVYGYLIKFVGSLKPEDLQGFLRFVTGSSVMLPNDITVVFNAATGLGRAIASHTCNSTIVIPTTYITYPDFANEFHSILQSDFGWIMDAI